MHRREFITRSALLLGTGLLARSPLRAAAGVLSPSGAFTPLRRGVGIYTARGGTIGWLATPDALLAVDSQFPDTARDFLQGLPDRDDRALDVLINTHHHPDHTAGNPVLGPAALRHVAHTYVPGLQRARAERDLALGKQVYATELFDRTWRADLGAEVVEARHVGPAHTAGDAIVHFQKANVVHLGDLVFNRVYPVIDRPGGADVQSWIKLLRELPARYERDTVYIYGHGQAGHGVTGDRHDLFVFADFLERLRDLVQSEIVIRKPRVQILARTGLSGYSDWELPNPGRFRDALAAVYDELTGADIE
ncbi:MAG: MBL fold metallo-hydrolase [Verrucomicrobiota bacterium]